MSACRLIVRGAQLARFLHLADETLHHRVAATAEAWMAYDFPRDSLVEAIDVLPHVSLDLWRRAGDTQKGSPEEAAVAHFMQLGTVLDQAKPAEPRKRL